MALWLLSFAFPFFNGNWPCTVEAKKFFFAHIVQKLNLGENFSQALIKHQKWRIFVERMQNKWLKALALRSPRQFVICYSVDGKKEKSSKRSEIFFSLAPVPILWMVEEEARGEDYKCFYWFNKNEGLLHCWPFICCELCSCLGAKDYGWWFHLRDKTSKRKLQTLKEFLGDCIRRPAWCSSRTQGQVISHNHRALGAIKLSNDAY
jgi:hypothetical protein